MIQKIHGHLPKKQKQGKPLQTSTVETVQTKMGIEKTTSPVNAMTPSRKAGTHKPLKVFTMTMTTDGKSSFFLIH